MSAKEISAVNSILRTLSEQADDLAPAFLEGDPSGFVDYAIDGYSKTRLDAMNHVRLSDKESHLP